MTTKLYKSNTEILSVHRTCHYCCLHRIRILKEWPQKNIVFHLLNMRELFALSLDQLQQQRNRQQHRATVHGTSCLQGNQELTSFPHNMKNEQQAVQLHPITSPVRNNHQKADNMKGKLSRG